MHCRPKGVIFITAGCAALTCGYENPTLRVISLLLIRMNYEL
jgi:hypothetical protein